MLFEPMYNLLTRIKTFIYFPLLSSYEHNSFYILPSIFISHFSYLILLVNTRVHVLLTLDIDEFYNETFKSVCVRMHSCMYNHVKDSILYSISIKNTCCIHFG